VLQHAVSAFNISLRKFDDSRLGITIDETVDASSNLAEENAEQIKGKQQTQVNYFISNLTNPSVFPSPYTKLPTYKKRE